MEEDIRINNILYDIQVAEFDNNAKKLVAEKYGINSRKISEITHYLYCLADSYRKEHTEFTKQDWTIWNRKWNAPFSYKKINEACEGESIEWIDFCIKITSDKKFPKDNRNEYFKKLKAERFKSQDTVLEELYDWLSIKTFPFKEKLYNNLIKFEKNSFDFLKSQEFTEEEIKNRDKFYISWLRMKTISNNFNWDFYKKKIDNEFERTFTSNIRVIAERLRPSNVKGDKLKLVKITEDPKFFEMVLKDNLGRTIHCRSIIAAEYSNKVTTHYRFIITIKNR